MSLEDKMPTTYGGIMNSLIPWLKEASVTAKEHFGEPKYFAEREKALHRAFDDWCSVMRIPPVERYVIFDRLKKFNSETPNFRVHVEVDDLFKTLPDEFNVRGQWTSRHVLLGQ